LGNGNGITLFREDLNDRDRVREFVLESYKGGQTEPSEDQVNADVDAILAQANAYYGWLQSRPVTDQLAALGASVASHPGADTPAADSSEPQTAPVANPPTQEGAVPGATPPGNL
jgi:hypothetical protein